MVISVISSTNLKTAFVLSKKGFSALILTTERSKCQASLIGYWSWLKQQSGCPTVSMKHVHIFHILLGTTLKQLCFCEGELITEHSRPHLVMDEPPLSIHRSQRTSVSHVQVLC